MKRIICALAILTVVVGTGAAYGQAQKGSITVDVIAEDGSALPGATVSASSDETLTRRTVVTDSRGVAVLVALDPASNYSVTIQLEGFAGSRYEEVLVRAGQDFDIHATLSLAALEEEVIVTGEVAIVDVTSAITGQNIDLQLTESLPTARSYQDYLQLVPGVMPAVDQGQGLNPASRSGLNYRDLLGEVGQSRDNFYYLEGINVTDGVQGLTQTNLNTEIIQEQSVLTGGLPAEFVGAPGLVSNVITKAGGNNFSGSVNYYFQNDSLVGDNDHFDDAGFDTTDAAITLGGPIVRDKAWFFGSYRNVDRDDDVASTDTGELIRTVNRNSDQFFLKGTWAPTSKDLLTGVFLSDPEDVSGQNNNLLSNARDFSENRGGQRYTFTYSRVFSSANLELGFSDHEGDLDQLSAINASLNDVSFRGGDTFTQEEEQQGGQGDFDFETRGTQTFRGSISWMTDTSWGSHTLKGGFELAEYDDFRDLNYVNGERYVSIAPRYQGDGLTNREVVTDFTTTDFDATNPSDYDGFISSVNSSPRRAEFYGLYDINGDGTISQDELADNMTYTSTAGNPDGQLNYGRRFTLQPGAATTSSEGQVFYVQDTWQHNKWSANVGVRAEEWEHFASTGDSIFTFDTEYAPRLSLVYDLRGDGRSRITAYYGRYYDPIRNNATNFVGSLTTREFEEQVYVEQLDEWVAFRTRGGTSQLDATFAPTTQTPYTDEIQIGYKTELGNNQSIEVNLIKRETRDIIEDYDYGLYADPDVYPGDINDPDSLFLGPEFFGFAEEPTSNFNIATLPPGNFRDWDGVELVYRKRYSNNWQALASYNYADATGNTNSDSNFDFAGDVLWLDPRAPNQTNTQPGLVEHLFKVAGSYNFDNGVQLGGTYRWNSGTIVSTTSRAFRRNLPVRVDEAFEFAGINDRWLRPDSVGQNDNNPSYGILDLRVAYLWDINNRWVADFFLDVFNVADDQKAVQTQDREGGGDGFVFGEGMKFVPPRRIFLGARLRF